MAQRLTPLIIAALMAAAAPALASGDEHSHRPAHAGIVFAGKAADYELVARPTVLQLYVSDHGKPHDVSRASARLTLLNGSTRQEVELKPAGDRLEATGTFNVAPGTRCVAVVSDGGKTLGTARFTLASAPAR